ncbi:hypothetical protein I4Q36_05500 [Tuanshanicoccus lijuaniae]|nr:hypothetical protein [Aerococcaceae bacterium zg-1292]QQA36283.1 hypothetical protein I4Q36_05500 [Aerococcaceae bacterium zg-1292]
MSYQEYVYVHDLSLVYDLIERYMTYHGLNGSNDEPKQEMKVEDARAFFI